jgi:single-stranded DNA-binding protein
VSYDERAIPTCAFTLEVNESGKEGQIYTPYLSIEIMGKYAEDAAERLEPGDEVMMDGRLKDKSHVDATTGQKTSKLIVTSWTVTPAVPRQMMAQASQTHGGAA